jgi:hypothetical protein
LFENITKCTVLGFGMLNNVDNDRLGLTKTAGFHNVIDLPPK